MISRRRFLTGLGAVGTVGLATWLTRSGNPPRPTASPETVTTAPTTLPPATTPPSTTTTAAATTTSSPQTTTTVEPVGALAVICKDAWGAMPVAGEFRQHTIDRITVHHTAVVLTDNRAAPARLRGHQEFHQGRGWPDIAYHFIIDAAGNIYEGRPVDAVGDTGTDYDPTGHFLVCCEGDFNQQPITPEQYRSLIEILAWGAAAFGVDPTTIQGHRDVASTSCPGDGLHALIADGSIATDVIAAEPGELRIVCGTEAEDLVAAVESG
ncbi:MAG: peptidoglycan recognition family protein [Acidimicrobiia bacterium]|nr:peptidoglycan recognition family protein [Acidimicrobiia bacterium]